MAKDISSHISIDKCTSIIDKWIAECNDEHESCYEESAANTEHIPSRLLDIRRRINDLILLVDTSANQLSETNPPIIRYATLSHCWGEVQLLRTMQSSLETHMQGIPLDILPRTFQDCIKILRALGINYVWIDSLCIVQDDNADWNKESARMCNIYSHSYLNVAATSARDSTGGCLNTRSLRQGLHRFSTQSFPVIDRSKDTSWNIYVRPSFESVHHRYNKHFGSNPDPLDKEVTPLLCRAWVLQERRLAPRTIHFHHSEMVMECKRGLRCECTVLDRQQRRVTKFAKTQSSRSHEIYETFGEWYELVEEYSQLSITQHSDRLIAFLGIATKFQEKTPCGFLAGLWDFDIAQGLMWDITGRPDVRAKMNLTRLKNPFAPSWSWASLVPGTNSPAYAIAFPVDETLTPHEKFRYLGTNIPKLANEWHLLSERGYITIKALVVPATIYNERRGPSHSIRTQLLFQSSPDRQFYCNSNRRYRINLDTTQTMVSSDCYGMNGTVIYCLIVATRTQSHHTTDGKSTWLYVLLCKQRICASQEVEYERVGIFSILKNDLPLVCSEEMIIKIF